MCFPAGRRRRRRRRRGASWPSSSSWSSTALAKSVVRDGRRGVCASACLPLSARVVAARAQHRRRVVLVHVACAGHLPDNAAILLQEQAIHPRGKRRGRRPEARRAQCRILQPEAQTRAGGAREQRAQDGQPLGLAHLLLQDTGKYSHLTTNI